MSARTEEKHTRLAFDLPLPLDVVTTVGALVALAYPDALLETDNGRQIVMLIPEKARGKRVTKKAAAAAKAHAPEDPREGGDLSRLDSDGWAVIPHEDVMLSMADMCARILDTDGPAGENYIEWPVIDRAAGVTYVLWAAKSPAQTPHALRQAAERRATAAEARVAELEAEVARLREERDETARRAHKGRARNW